MKFQYILRTVLQSINQPHRWSSTQGMIQLTTKWKAELDAEIQEKIKTKEMKLKKHPGIRDVKCVNMSERLQTAISNMIANYSLKELQKKSRELVNFLANRKMPIEDLEVEIHSKELFQQLDAERGEVESLAEEEKEAEVKKRKAFVTKILKQRFIHWKAIEYDAYKGMLYLLGRIAPNYAVLYWIFSELSNQNPDFKPTTLFDFGSGVGSTTWAASTFWKGSLREYFNVDTSADMNDIARILLQGGKEGDEMWLKGVFYRQFLPASHLLRYNLVVSAFSLLELPNVNSRLQIIDSLWKKTEDYLIIVEDGTNAGYETVTEARDYILNRKTHGETSGHIFAPCPHDLNCPRFTDGTNTPCNFEVSYMPLALSSANEAVTHRFSYLVLKKEDRSTTNKSWPRIVRPVLCRGKHVVCRLCTNDGHLKEMILTKSKVNTELYNCARASKWGDLLPITNLQLKTAEEINAEKADREQEKEYKQKKDKVTDSENGSKK